MPRVEFPCVHPQFVATKYWYLTLIFSTTIPPYMVLPPIKALLIQGRPLQCTAGSHHLARLLNFPPCFTRPFFFCSILPVSSPFPYLICQFLYHYYLSNYFTLYSTRSGRLPPIIQYSKPFTIYFHIV